MYFLFLYLRQTGLIISINLMPAIFSKSGEYAMQAVLYLAKHSASHPILLKEIAESLNIPRPYLNKLLQVLIRAGIVESHKGLRGGFSLARPANTIRLEDVVRSVEGHAISERCVLGFPSCNEANPCPVHADWKHARSIIHGILSNRTIDEITTGFDITHRVSDS